MQIPTLNRSRVGIVIGIRAESALIGQQVSTGEQVQRGLPVVRSLVTAIGDNCDERRGWA